MSSRFDDPKYVKGHDVLERKELRDKELEHLSIKRAGSVKDLIAKLDPTSPRESRERDTDVSVKADDPTHDRNNEIFSKRKIERDNEVKETASKGLADKMIKMFNKGNSASRSSSTPSAGMAKAQSRNQGPSI